MKTYTLELTLEELNAVSVALTGDEYECYEKGVEVSSAHKRVVKKIRTILDAVRDKSKAEVKTSLKTLADMLKDKGLK